MNISTCTLDAASGHSNSRDISGSVSSPQTYSTSPAASSFPAPRDAPLVGPPCYGSCPGSIHFARWKVSGEPER
jgi:hypothetical protein